MVAELAAGLPGERHDPLEHVAGADQGGLLGNGTPALAVGIPFRECTRHAPSRLAWNPDVPTGHGGYAL